MFSIILTSLVVIGCSQYGASVEAPRHSRLAFKGTGLYLQSMEDFCESGNECIDEPVRIGAWNVQRLGTSKMNREDVMDVFVKVIHNYDIIVLQEVTDASGESVKKLLEKTNEFLEPEEYYDIVVSPRVGRTSYKEQYVYFYKPSRVQFVEAYLFNDTVNDLFQFDPYVAHFNSSIMGPLHDLVIIPLHAKPSEAEIEIDALVEVYEDAVHRWNIEDVMMLGDFNAGCSYVVQKEFQNIRLFTNATFDWLISDHADTTTKTTSCPYDRIVVAGDVVKKQAYYKTASTFYFDEALEIDQNWELVSGVSDHYPVGVMIRGSAPPFPTVSSVGVGVDLHPNGWCEVYALLNAMTGNSCDSRNGDGAMYLSNVSYGEWTKEGLNAAMEFLSGMSDLHPSVITKEAVSILGYKLSHGAVQDQTLFTQDLDPLPLRISLTCRGSTVQCTLSITRQTEIN